MRKSLFIVMFIIIVCCCIIAEAEVTLNESDESILEAVENFSGSSKLDLEINDYIITPHAKYYLVTLPEKSEYWINEKTHEVEGYISYSEYNNISDVEISLNDAFYIANDFAKKHFNGFLTKNLILVENESYDFGQISVYHFIWREYMVNNIEGPSVIDIVINPTNGMILSYGGINRDIIIPVTSTITKENAILIGKSQFENINISNSETRLKIWYDEKGNQQLFWIVDIRGTGRHNIFTGGEVFIDASSGDVKSVNRYN